MTASERNIHLGLLGTSLAVAAWVFGGQWHAAEPATHSAAYSPATDERSPLSIIPPGSAFLLSVDPHAFASSPLGGFIFERVGRSVGASKLARLCGFDPLARLDRLALAVPSANLVAQEHPEDFGIVAAGRFTASEITRCANAAIAARGGVASQTRLGSFDSVRDRQAGSGEIASKDGLVVVSGGSYFRELLDAAEGKRATGEAGELRDARHAELRRALGRGQLFVTWVLGEGWFERMTGDDTNARLSPLGELKTVAARVDFGATAELLVLLDCADSEGATRISSLLDELRSSLHALPLDPALAALAKRITVNRTGARLKLGLELNQSELSPVLDALLGPKTGERSP